MMPALEWLRALWGRRGRNVALAYQARLNPADSQARLVLRDLATYCHAGASAMAPTPHETAFLAGRQDAYAHIAEMLGLKPDQIVFEIRGDDDE